MLSTQLDGLTVYIPYTFCVFTSSIMNFFTATLLFEILVGMKKPIYIFIVGNTVEHNWMYKMSYNFCLFEKLPPFSNSFNDTP